MACRLALLALCSLALALLAAAQPKSAEECSALGFNSALTLCSDCEALQQALNDQQTASECRACCSEGEAADDAGPFAAAVLEVDSWSLPAYPEINDFVEKRAASFPRLSVRTIGWRVAPTLVLTAAGGGEPVRVKVGGWKTDSLSAYLTSRLLPGAPEKAAKKVGGRKEAEAEAAEAAAAAAAAAAAKLEAEAKGVKAGAKAGGKKAAEAAAAEGASKPASEAKPKATTKTKPKKAKAKTEPDEL